MWLWDPTWDGWMVIHQLTQHIYLRHTHLVYTDISLRIPYLQSILQSNTIINKNKMSSTALHNKKATTPIRTRGAVFGGCVESTNGYSHDYEHCEECDIPHDKVTPCFIENCPCNGQGFLLEVETEPGKNQSHVHQVPWQHKRVRVCLQRPAEARRRIGELNAKIAATAIEQEELPSAKQKRARDGDDDDKEEDNVSFGDEQGESNTKKQKISDTLFIDGDENAFPHSVSMVQDTSQSDNNSFFDPDDNEGGVDDIYFPYVFDE